MGLFCKTLKNGVRGQKSAHFMSKGAIFKQERKKALYNSFVMLQFSYFNLFSLRKANFFVKKLSMPCFMN